MTLDELSLEQRRAASHTGGPLLVKGLAGTGKSTVVAARAAMLLDSGIPEEKVVLISRTDSAAAVLLSKVEGFRNGLGERRVQSYTFHTWCKSLVDRFQDELGIRGFTLSDSSDLSGFAPSFDWRISVSSWLPDLLPVIYVRYVTARVSLEEAIFWAFFRRNGFADIAEEAKVKLYGRIKTAIEEYIDFKYANKLYDEIDVQNLVAGALSGNPSIQQAVLDNTSHILIDDVQDLSPLQYEILKALAPGCELFFAGDATLSIDSSRGADWKSLDRIPELFPGTEVLTLKRNFRSTQEIQDLALWVLAASSLGYDVDPPQTRGSGQVPQIVCNPEKSRLYDAVAEDIRRNVGQYGYRYEDHLLMAATDSELYGPRISLTRRGIPCLGPPTVRKRRFQGEHVFQLLEVFSAYCVEHPDSSMGEAFLAARKAFEASLPSDSYIFNGKCQKEYDALQELAGQSADRDQFLALLTEKSIQTVETGYKADNCIRIETVHAARDKEAEICYLWDISYLFWPKRDETRVEELLEEKRRLLSVAISRARSKVVILSEEPPVVFELSKKKRKNRFFLVGVGPLAELVAPEQ